jgi:hypothetical protein
MTTVVKTYGNFFLSVLFVGCCSFSAFSQSKYGANDTLVVPAIVYQGDTIPYKELAGVYVFGKMSEAQREVYRQWTRLRNAVYVTYPYAKKAGAVFNDINLHLVGITEKSKRRAYIKTRERDLRREFANPLTELSVYQGKILMKLIARETGNTCYEIIDDLKGGFSAHFWQAVAWVFGSSLKQTYDSQGEDAVIEVIVQEVKRMYGI